MKAKDMNQIARGINARRNEFSAIVNDFRAVWGKVYRNELKAEFDAVVDALKGDPKNAELKNKRYAIEQVQAKVKSLNLSADERDLVRVMHDEDGLAFADLTIEYLYERLRNSMFVAEFSAEDGRKVECLMEQKKNKETGEKEWKIVEKWTVLKVGRYFRLANIAA